MKIQLIIIIFLFNIRLLIPSNLPVSINCELVFQVQDYVGSNIQFRVESINGEDEFCGSGYCSFELIDPTDIDETITFTADYYNLKKGLVIEGPCNQSLSSNSDMIEIRYGKYKITVSEGGTRKFTFTYDVRDCVFGTGSCGPCSTLTPSNDVTIRYDATNDDIYYYDGHDSQYSSTWSGWTSFNDYANLTWWDIKGCTGNYRCAIDVPEAPESLEITSSYNEYVELSWDESSSTDVDYYLIYRSVDGGNFQNIASVSSTTTTYTDDEITIGIKFDPIICYFVTALDGTDLESDNSNSVYTHSNSYMNKKTTSKIANEKLKNHIKSYPNPFNPSTNIVYSLKKDSWVKVSLYDQNGQLLEHLVDEQKIKGEYTVQLNFKILDYKLSSGIYFIRLNSHDFNESIKINYIK